MSRNIRQHLADLSGDSVRGMDYGKLANAFSKDVKANDAEDLRNEVAREHSIKLHDGHLDWMKRTIAEAIDKESAEISGTLPIISVFEAAQTAKNAVQKYSRDVGVLNLSALLDRKWKADREAQLTTSDVIMLKDHYNKNFPKSAARGIIEDFTKDGYLDLPIGSLMDIAAQIRTQDDFEYCIKEAGLHTNNPYNQKARKFILALLNGEKTAQMGPSDPRSELMERLDKRFFDAKSFYKAIPYATEDIGYEYRDSFNYDELQKIFEDFIDEKGWSDELNRLMEEEMADEGYNPEGDLFIDEGNQGLVTPGY